MSIKKIFADLFFGSKAQFYPKPVQRVSYNLPTAAGWYRIAETGVAVGAGLDCVRGYLDTPNLQQKFEIQTTWCFQDAPILTLTSNVNKGSSSGISYARIVYPSNTVGAKAFLEIYKSDGTYNHPLYLDFEGGAWVPYEASQVGAVDAGCSSVSITFAEGMVTSSSFSAGGTLKGSGLITNYGNFETYEETVITGGTTPSASHSRNFQLPSAGIWLVTLTAGGDGSREHMIGETFYYTFYDGSYDVNIRTAIQTHKSALGGGIVVSGTALTLSGFAANGAFSASVNFNVAVSCRWCLTAVKLSKFSF